MKPQIPTFRFSPGRHVFESEDEGWLLYEPSGAFVRLRAQAESLRGLIAHLDADVAEDVAAREVDDAVHDLLKQFESRGVIERASTAQHETGHDESSGLDAKRGAFRRVQVCGTGPIANVLAQILGGEDDLAIEAVEDDAAPESIDHIDLVIDCAGWLPDTRWQARDEACREHAIAWHGCYAEGSRFYLGPFFLPDDASTVSYRDARARRMAAAPYPEGLEGYWRYLDAGPSVVDVAWPDAGRVAQLAGALAADVIAWARGETPPSHGHQLAFAPVTGRWTWHPVLPVPRGLMTEAASLESFAFEVTR